MFGGFSMAVTTADSIVACADERVLQAQLAYPGAGAIFAESLPVTEHQIVREMSAGWQSIFCLRDNRVTEMKHGQRTVSSQPVLDQLLFELRFYIPDRTHQLLTKPENTAERIICYIHKQDGQKG